MCYFWIRKRYGCPGQESSTEGCIIPLSNRPIIGICYVSNKESWGKSQIIRSYFTFFIGFSYFTHSCIWRTCHYPIRETLERNVICICECISCFCGSVRRNIERIIPRSITIGANRTTYICESTETVSRELDCITENPSDRKKLIFINIVIKSDTNIYCLDSRYINNRISILIVEFKTHRVNLSSISYLQIGKSRGIY